MSYTMPFILGILTFYTCSIAFANSQSFVTVNVTNGTLIGSLTDFKVAIFSAIPYAAPPIGDLRFEAPQPANWNGTLDVSAYDNRPTACLQFIPKTTIAIGDENCLLLHVLTPNITGNLPVLFWIHGGAYIFGFGGQFPLAGLAQNLASRGVVVVAINYRLHAFGFFTSRTDEFPGNMGMLDQVQALRWVQAEIRNFGGDPDQVTIMGESAGAASVSLLSYSPMGRGLFKRAIMESGTAYTLWAWNGAIGIYDDSSGRFAVTLNCTTDAEWQSGQNYTAIVQCLKQKTASEVLRASRPPSTSRAAPSTLQLPTWGPVVGPFTQFLPKTLTELQRERRPFTAIIGNTNAEASPYSILLQPYPDITSFDASSFDDVLANPVFDKAYGQYTDAFKLIAKYHYTQQSYIASDDNSAWLNAVVNIESDFAFFYAAVKEAQILLNSNSTVYLYSFDYLSNQTDWYPTYKGVPHTYDLWFQFLYFSNPNADDSAIEELAGKFITNFAKTGDPNKPDPLPSTTWSPITQSSRADFFSISTPPQMKASFHWDAYQLFDGLFQQMKPYIATNGTTTSAETIITTTTTAVTTTAAATTGAITTTTTTATSATSSFASNCALGLLLLSMNLIYIYSAAFASFQ